MKTKEQIIHNRAIGHGNGLAEFEYDELLAAMDLWAKQQSIAFMKWNAQQVSGYLDYLRRVDQAEGVTGKEKELNFFEGATIEGRFTQFIEYQKSEQQNTNK